MEIQLIDQSGTQFGNLILNCYLKLFDDVGPYHIETSLLISRADQWTSSCRIGTYVMKELTSHKIVIFSG